MHKEYSNHRHSFYELVFIEKGTGTHQVDFVDYRIAAPTLFCISPGQVHNFDRGNIERGVVIIFEKEFVYRETPDAAFLIRFAFLSNQMPDIRLDSQDENNFFACISIINGELKLERPDFETIRSALKIMLAGVLRSGRKELEKSMLAESQHKKTFFDFVWLIEEHYNKNHDVSFYADKLFLTAKHLNEMVRSATGETAIQTIHGRIVVEAKRLLFYSEHSIKEIADRLGFEDASYFSRFFTRHTGTSPSGFQKENPKSA